MRFRHSTQSNVQQRAFRQNGSVVLTALILTFVASLVLASYLLLTRSDSVASMRSQAWNLALAVAEAGVEEALTHLNSNGTNIVANNGWELVDGKYLRKSGGVAENRYNVAILLA